MLNLYSYIIQERVSRESINTFPRESLDMLKCTLRLAIFPLQPFKFCIIDSVLFIILLYIVTEYSLGRMLYVYMYIWNVCLTYKVRQVYMYMYMYAYVCIWVWVQIHAYSHLYVGMCMHRCINLNVTFYIYCTLYQGTNNQF